MNKLLFIMLFLTVLFTNKAYARCSPTEQSIISIIDCGASGEDDKSDVSAINAAIQYAIINKARVYVPNGVYIIDSTLNVNGSTLKMVGQSKESSIFKVTTTEAAINVGHDTQLSNLKFTQDEKLKGIAINTPKGSYRSKFENLYIENFDKAIYQRQTVSNIYRNIEIENVNTGIELHSKNKDGTPSTGSWNYYKDGENGWHNNVHLFSNILISNVKKYGFKLEAMSISIENTQIKADPVVANSIGIFMGGRNSTSNPDKMFNNAIKGSKIEGFDTAIKLKSAQYTYIEDPIFLNNRIDIDSDEIDLINLVGASTTNKLVLNSSNLRSDMVTENEINDSKSLISDFTFPVKSFRFNLNADTQKVVANLNELGLTDGTYCITTTGIRNGVSSLQQSKLVYDSQNFIIIDYKRDGIDLSLNSGDSQIRAKSTYAVLNGKVSISNISNCE